MESNTKSCGHLLIEDCNNLSSFEESYYRNKELVYIGEDCEDYKFLHSYTFFDFDDSYCDFPIGYDRVCVNSENGEAYALPKKLFTLKECIMPHLRELTLNKIL